MRQEATAAAAAAAHRSALPLVEGALACRVGRACVELSAHIAPAHKELQGFHGFRFCTTAFKQHGVLGTHGICSWFDLALHSKQHKPYTDSCAFPISDRLNNFAKRAS